MSSITSASFRMNGIDARIMSIMVVPDGATPFITNRQKPKGGVFSPISILISVSSPNHIKSIPSMRRMGKKMGKVIIIIDTCSIKEPRTRRSNCIAMKSTIGGSERPTTNSAKPFVAPLKAKIWLKATEPVRIMNIITTI